MFNLLCMMIVFELLVFEGVMEKVISMGLIYWCGLGVLIVRCCFSGIVVCLGL